MTRENKLALVVGFGLILFVGILISDHFSIARSQAAANLAGLTDPQARTQQREAALVDLNVLPEPAPPTPPAASAPQGAGPSQPPSAAPPQAPGANARADAGLPSELSRPEYRSGIDPNADLGSARELRDPMASRTRSPSAAEAENRTSDSAIPPGFERVAGQPDSALRFHEVQPGESLYAICKNEYGDPALVTALAKFNKMDDAGQLRTGRRLVLPEAEALGGSSTKETADKPAAKSAAPPVKPATPKTYTVQKGDNLSLIAQKHLGSKERWRELHALNRNIIDDPNNLKVGMVIRLS